MQLSVINAALAVELTQLLLIHRISNLGLFL